MNRFQRIDKIVLLCRDKAKSHNTSELADYCTDEMGETISRKQVYYALTSRGIAVKTPDKDLLVIHKNNMLTKSWDAGLKL